MTLQFGTSALGKTVNKTIKSVSYDKNLKGDERIILRFDEGEYLDIELTKGILAVSFIKPRELSGGDPE